MKHHRLPLWRLLVIVFWPLAALAGCHANHTGQAASCEWSPGCYETPLCFGYHSTCWRPWPEECPNCPPFTLVAPHEVESVAPPAGASPGAPAGAGDVLPVPMPPKP